MLVSSASGPISPETEAVTAIAGEVRRRLEQEGRAPALRYAMSAIEPLLRFPNDALRQRLREQVFGPFTRMGLSYQSNDFECVDYHQYEIADDLPLFRGPPLPKSVLGTGDYFCAVGAAQTFGRLVAEPWPTLLGRAAGLPVLNLSRAGAGPELFLDRRLLHLIQNARFVVVQVMSGRSVGDDEFPGGRRIEGNAAFEGLNRLDVLRQVWEADRHAALQTVRRWNARYLDVYRQLRAEVRGPTMVLWLSSRKPADWRPKMLLEALDSGGVSPARREAPP